MWHTKNAFFREIQFWSHCYTVVSYQALFRLSVYQITAVYLSDAKNVCFCTIRDFGSPTINTLRVLHVNQTYICLHPLEIRVRKILLSMFKPSFFIISSSCLSVILSYLFLAALWSSSWKADLLALLYVISSCLLSLSHMVSWFKCDIWLYHFLIFAFFLT